MIDLEPGQVKHAGPQVPWAVEPLCYNAGYTLRGEEYSLKEFLKWAPRPFSAGKETTERDIPSDMWVKCSKCGALLYSKEFEKSLLVCQKCGYHTRLSAKQRIAMLCDLASFEEIGSELEPCDPLGFVSLGQEYRKKLSDVQKKTGLKDSMIAGTASISGLPVAITVMDFDFIGASISSVVGEKLVRTVETAIANRLPYISVNCSGGARMQEGIFSLMQLGKITAALVRLGERRLPHFSLLTDPTYGGVSASYGTAADVIMAEPGALIGFAGGRLIEQITKQKLPPGFQTAEFLLEHGMLDMVVPRRELRTTLSSLIRLYGNMDPEFQGGNN